MEIIYDELILRDDYMLMEYGIRKGDTLDVINNNELYKDPDLFNKLYEDEDEGDPNDYNPEIESENNLNIKRFQNIKNKYVEFENIFKNYLNY